MKILVAIVDPARDRGLIDVAAGLSKDDGEIVVASVIEVPEGETLASAQPQARARRRELTTLAGSQSVRPLVTVARLGWAAIAEAAREERPDLLLIGWRRPGWDYLGTTIEDILRDPPCDLAIVKGPAGRARRILVPVRGGRYAELAAKIGVDLARARGGTVTLLHVAPEDRTSRRKSATLYQLVGERAFDERVDELLTRVGDAEPIITDELSRHDLVLFGASGGPEPLGPIGQRIIGQAKAAIIVRTRTPVASSVFLQPTALPTDRTGRSTAIGELVDKWFVENTFTSAEFADLASLVAQKEKQGVRISVALPTLNEEATIGKVITAIRSRLMERFPLVDELVVIDSDSTDRTREIAEKLGVPVHIHQQVLPEIGPGRGKGEALWKSLAITTGDLVVWVDTDVSQFHPKFVYGLIGPLLIRPEIAFVKAFYRRPLNVGGELQATGGGRVTELAARPILNLFFPELSGIIQPLSGEQAGRRSLLERLPFFDLYGVETGLLIDVLRTTGLRSIAQVDMKQRIHRNQSLLNLSKTSFEILQVAMKRLGDGRGQSLLDDANLTMKLISPTAEGFHLDVQDIGVVERPPMITVPSYRDRAR
ncbi:MAG TPA: glucosyl-3-phosphoglycerate synthase [Candidatus Saccharimonadales bacterium]|jgi:glucosyl-3-phosphoglycerate synthase|nr:glucosyl-3-phosphoglycerate synthase [Candidatus Saccharimonadales bacterium]